MRQLSKIASISPLEFTAENLPTGVVTKGSDLKLCKSIGLDYPVLESMTYSNFLVPSNSIVLILSLAGRPKSFQVGETWDSYDILDILVEGRVYQCFRSSLNIITF